MNEWLRAWLLGAVQGLTEFLPVSSSGHLALLQILTRGSIQESGADFVFFDVMLHLGTLVAIALYYRSYLTVSAREFLRPSSSDSPYTRRNTLRLAGLVFLALLPLVPMKLFLADTIKSTYENLGVVGVGFAITACLLLATLALPGGNKTAHTMTWLDALVIGLAQAIAPVPGISRSGITIVAALLRGFNRGWAVGFSLLISIPAIMAAAASELVETPPSEISITRGVQIVTATIIAGAVGYLAIATLVRIVQARKLWYFSIYLLGLSIFIAAFVIPKFGSKPPSHDQPPALDGAVSGRALLGDGGLAARANR